MQRTTIHARLLVAIVAMLGLTFGMANNVAAEHDQYGVCHRTGTDNNPYVYIKPDQGSNHIDPDTHEPLPNGNHEEDRVATAAEAEAKACEGQTEFPTEEPTEEPTEVPTEEPTEAPTEEPTEAPTEEPTEGPTEEPTDVATQEPTAEPTEKPVTSLPETGATPNDSNGGLILAMTSLAAFFLIAAAALIRRSTTR